MRILTILTILVIVLFTACRKERSLQRGLDQVDRIMIVDKFGLEDHQFNKVKRPELELAARRFPKKPRGGGNGGNGGGGGTDTTNNDGGGGGTNPPPPPPPPTGDKVILLDFDGQYVANTYWNSGGPINAAHANLTGEQQAAILDSVRWDYRQFDVVVTTDEALYQAANPYKRTRVIITESYEWFGMAGGVAYLGSFSWGNDTPCWVFSSLLGYSVKNIFEATSHEAGHTLGLHHQSDYDASGNKINEYRNGVIMGVGYYNPDVNWIIGMNSMGAIQNDTLIIGQTLRQ